MSTPVPIKIIAAEENSDCYDSVATIAFDPNGLNLNSVRIIRYPSSGKPQPPLLYVSVGAILAWSDYCLPEWFDAEDVKA